MKPIWPLDENCPCGSGQKYNVCHFGKVYRNHAELVHDVPKFLQSKYGCIAPTSEGFCGHPTIKSHTISRSNSLKAIAVSNHVYTFTSGPNAKPAVEDRRTFQKVSISKASTFPGFCPEHDHSIFLAADAEVQKIDFRTSLLHSYRGACYEAAVHSRGAFFNVFVAENAQFHYPFSPDYATAETALMLKWARHCWERKRIYEARLERKSSRKYWFAAGHTREILPFASLGCFPIEVDFSGRRLQDNHSDEKFAFCELWVIPTKLGTTFGIGALEIQNPKALQHFIRSFSSLSRAEMVTRILQLALVHIENTYFNIPFLDSLTSLQRDALLDFFHECLVDQVGDRRPIDALTRTPIVRLPQRVDTFFSNSV